MNRDEQEDTTVYKVVVNLEEQYSIWPVDRENPAGWRDDGKTGPKQECLAYINEVWTDMRPLSLRRQMEQQAQDDDDESLPAARPYVVVGAPHDRTPATHSQRSTLDRAHCG